MTFRESAFYGKSYFAKKNIKIALAPPIELFMELKSKKTPSLAKWSRAKKNLIKM